MTTRPLNRFIAPAIAAIAIGVCAVGAASAQSSSRAPEKLEPPTPGTAKNDGIVWPMLVGIVLAGAALTVNLNPSKRGHQD